MDKKPIKSTQDPPESKPKSQAKHKPAKKTKPIKFSLFSKGFKLVFGLSLSFLIISLLAIIAYAAWIDKDVRAKFEGKRWDIPAQAYARALELFPGKIIKKADLIIELNLLGYIQKDNLSGSGTYKQTSNIIEITSRDFRFWDGREKSIQAQITFRKNKIKHIKNSSGEEVFIMRLDPLAIGSFYPGKGADRALIKLEELPDIIPQTLIAVEDKAFMSHLGVNPLAIVRAMLINMKAGKTMQGGSTITEQLAKNFYLSQERTLKRRLKSTITAILLEIHYSKAEIMETYLNEVYLAQSGDREIHGIAMASQFYFGRQPHELNIAQVASIIALLKAPSTYNPRRNPGTALKRRNLVLNILKNDQIITKEQYQVEKSRPLEVSNRGIHSNLNTSYPDFMGLVKEQLLRDYNKEDLLSEGIKVFTTLDPIIQMQAENATVKQMPKLDRRAGFKNKTLESATVISQIETGEVVALIGGRDFRIPGFNRAVTARRQIGSLIKPLIYLSALERADLYTLGTLLDDSKLRVKSGGKYWSPDNYDHKEHENPFLITALAKSYNLATARLGIAVGIPIIVEKLKKFGFTEEVHTFPSLLLGAVNMSPVQVTQYFLTLANKGFNIPLRSIRSVTNQIGEPVKSYNMEITQIVDEKTAFLTYRAMREVVRNGTASKINATLKSSLNIAGKTGTTNKFRDSWFAGFSGNYLTVNWVGRDDNKPSRLSGSAGALPLWINTMQRLNLTKFNFPTPRGIKYSWVNKKSGLLSDKNCINAVNLPFIAGTSPFESGPCFPEEELDDAPRKKPGFFNWVFGKNRPTVIKKKSRKLSEIRKLNEIRKRNEILKRIKKRNEISKRDEILINRAFSKNRSITLERESKKPKRIMKLRKIKKLRKTIKPKKTIKLRKTIKPKKTIKLNKTRKSNRIRKPRKIRKLNETRKPRKIRKPNEPRKIRKLNETRKPKETRKPNENSEDHDLIFDD